MGSKFDLIRQTWVRKGSKFSFSSFLAEHVRSLGLLEGFGWILGSALVDKPWFGRVLSSDILDLGLGLT